MSSVYTVTELAQRIRDRLEGDPRLHDLWTRGELSNVVNARSGHRYFTLKDRDSQISCVIFRGQGLRLDFDLCDGQNVFVFGDVGLYSPRGQVQLVARGLRLDSGVGLRRAQFEALKRKLQEEGLFDEERKRHLPRYPARIGIVTSPDGAALRDVMKILGSYPARVILSPALVQGEASEESIARAIRALEGRADVVIVCRGGGSAEDLWSFNSEAVARAIFECDSPVISAIGHETDVTISDFVADVRAPTPTAAAKMAAPDLTELKEDVLQMEVRMVRAVYRRLDKDRDRIEYLERGISPRRISSLVQGRRQNLDYLSERLCSACDEKALELRRRLESAGGRLHAISPLNTLSRGYAIALTPAGGLILRSGDAEVGDEIEVLFRDGRLLCKVMGRTADEGGENGRGKGPVQ